MLRGMVKTLAFMVLQIAVVAGCVWLEYDSAPLYRREPQLGIAFAMGVFFAFIVTAGIIAARDLWTRLSARISRPHSDSPTVLGRTQPEISQAGGESSRLAASARSLDKPTKISGSLGPG